MMRKRGKFILFDGIDGSGKSTQCEMLYQYALQKHLNCIKLFEPTTGEWGLKIRKMLSMDTPPPVEEQINMFIKDRMEDVSKNINPALSEGKIIIMDRYFYSNAAYQGTSEMLPEKIIQKNIDLNFPIPDRIYFLDIDPEAGIERIKKRNTPDEMEIFEKLAFQQQVRENFLSIINSKFMVLNGENTREKIFTEIINDFTSVIGESL